MLYGPECWMAALPLTKSSLKPRENSYVFSSSITKPVYLFFYIQNYLLFQLSALAGTLLNEDHVSGGR